MSRSRKRRYLKLGSPLLLICATAAPGVAAATTLVAPRIQAQRCAPCRISVDGLLEESLWSQAERGDTFVQIRPNELAPATERTRVQVGYDDANVYVAIHAADREPEAIRGLLARRDSEPPSDWVRVAFDSYADRRTAFEFGVNPAGLKVDARVSGDSQRDLTWDAIWDVATRRVADGWVAEFRIPLSELRYSDGGAGQWGLQVTRVVVRKNEVSNWAPTLQSDNRVVTRYGTLDGMNEVKASKTLQLVPYALADVSRPARSAALWDRGSLGLGLRGGGDAKARLTSNLTLDATVNPDFGQVEADPSVVNLTAFETYFSERRPFFVEGAEILRFGVGIGDGDLGRDTLYYSRRLGGLPAYSYNLDLDGDGEDDAEVLDEPATTNIYGAVKLSGKSAAGTSVALLGAVTGPGHARLRFDGGAERRELVAPLTSYVVARGQQDYRDGHTSVGAIVTSVVRDDAVGVGVIPPVRYATAVGVDASHRSMDDHYQIDASLAFSDVRGPRAAIEELQTAPARYFQRPDNHHAELDPERTSLQGYAATVSAGKVGGDPWRYAAFTLLRSPGFEVNDLGFLGSADQISGVLWGGYRDFKPGRYFRNISANTNLLLGADFGGEAINRYANVQSHFELLNYWETGLGFELHAPARDTTMLRGGPAFTTPWRPAFWMWVESDSRRPFSAEAFAVYSWEAHERAWRVEPELTLRPSSRLNVSLSLEYGHRERDRQYVDAVEEGGATHYVVGRMNQDTWALILRADLTLAPELSVQLYAQPFVSGGDYRDDGFREVTVESARADRYQDRFVPFAYQGDDPDFSFKQFRSTLVARWEYHPGSALFVVWSQDRTNEELPARVRLGRDAGRLFRTRGEDVVLVKLSYWLGV